ncbi:MAG: hypothetical protein U0172_04185 [Nitrospiraceae bacterium]
MSGHHAVAQDAAGRAAAPPPPERQTFAPLRPELALRGWISSGTTTWAHNASAVEPTVGNPTSRLRYKDVAVNYVELSGSIRPLDRYLLRATFGFADVGGGRLTDDDFVSNQGATTFNTATPGAQRVSRTISDIKGDASWYLELEGGGRLLNYPGHRGGLDGFVGYRYWYQRHIATGVGQVDCTSPTFCDPIGTVSHKRQDVIRNAQTWHALELGLESDYRLFRWLSLHTKGAFLPVNLFTNDDVHVLRSDLQQNPSFRMNGWGIGGNLEASLRAEVVPKLCMEVGYRLWWNQMVDGTWKNFPTSGGGVSVPLQEFSSIRQGLTVGLRYTF